MHYTKLSASRLLELMEQIVVIRDGAMGTMIQSFLIAIFFFPAENLKFSPFVILKHFEPLN